jgi:hypothetical protein
MPCHDRKLDKGNTEFPDGLTEKETKVILFQSIRAFSITFVSFSVSHQGIQYYLCLFFCQSIRAFSITFVSFSFSPSGACHERKIDKGNTEWPVMTEK